MISSLKQDIKNVIGWKTRRKIVVFSVDDYGNVRLASRKAREDLDRSGMKVISPFDAYDTLETREDLEILYESLSQYRDIHGRSAVFTSFSVPCNIDFDRMAEEAYSHYHSELLPQTFEKLSASDPSAYEGAWSLLKQGMEEGLLVPQYHGREHFNVKIFEDKLKEKDHQLLTSLKNRSLTSLSPSGKGEPGYTSAFGFWDFSENQRFEHILEDGLDAFEKVYGYRPVHFMPPGGNEHNILHHYSAKLGIRYIDISMVKREHQGHGRYKTRLYYTGEKKSSGVCYMVRNIVFEPVENRGEDSVNLAMKQIEAAFRWNRPAIISSHRVNFCGHVNPENRVNGITALKDLLKRITERWPDVEFMSADQLGDLIVKEK